MCGICGIISSESISDRDASLVCAMNDALTHRGPDSEGRFRDANVMMAMRRLSIIDVAGGSQPLISEDDSLVLVANGEIYNHIELRKELELRGHTFRTRSDCEAIVHLYEEFGCDCLSYLRGMFAFALWDKRRGELFLARDRIGEKPLYLHRREGRIVFASELKGLLRGLGGTVSLDASAVDRYMHYQYVPEPQTLVGGVEKLRAGHFLMIRVQPWQCTQRCYWRIESSPPVICDDPVGRIRGELDEVTSLTLRSDVPVGVALSAGLDSNVVTALSAPKYNGDLHAFSVGYAGRPPCDERAGAAQTARRLNIPCHHVEISPDDIAASFEELAAACDDPIADVAAFGYFAVMKAAREHNVPVMLTGFGGDELFWGYPWIVKTLHDNLQKLCNLGDSADARRRISRELTFYEQHPDFQFADQVLPHLYRPAFSERLPCANSLAPFRSDETFDSLPVRICKALFDVWLAPDCIALGDRLSMASSVELRLPLLDYRLVELVMGLHKARPDSYRLGHKAWLKEAARSILPPEVIDRPKSGFAPPAVQWVASLMHDFGPLLADGFLVGHGVFDPERLRRFLAQPVDGHVRHMMYKLLFLEVWCRRVLAGHTAAECRTASGTPARPRARPQLSIIVTVYQKEFQIGRIIEGIIDNTTSPFELVMVYDGCTDRSEERVNEVLARKRGDMRKLTVVHTPDVNETRANNAGMKAADGRFFILVQDDMLILETGWEKRLLAPMLRWDDVFAVSARNAHNYRLGLPPDTSVRTTCTEEAARDVLKIRLAVNRGPLALDADAVRRLNYLDEAYAPLYFDDMDLCVRAYRDLGKVCGVYKIGWKNLRTTVGSNKDQPLSTGGIWNDSCRKNLRLFWERYHTYLQGNDHDEDRPLRMDPVLQVTPRQERHGQAMRHNQRGVKLFAEGDAAAALDAFSQALAADPADLLIYNNLAMLHWRTGAPRKALENLMAALRIDPDDRRTVLTIVRCYKALNLRAEATALIRLYLQKWGDDAQLKAELASLDRTGAGDAAGHAAAFAQPLPGKRRFDMQILGTDYGGWAVALDLIPPGSIVISAGVGEDISFDLRLIELRNCIVVGVDPTEKACDYVRRSAPRDFHFLQKALHPQTGRRIRIYRNSNPAHVSESILPTHANVLANDYYEAETISLPYLLQTYPNVSVVKMDVEGAEYDVLNSLETLTVPQLCVEFHHACTHYTINDTMACIRHLGRLGYVCAHTRSKAGPFHEVTFVHQEHIDASDGNGRRAARAACVPPAKG